MSDILLYLGLVCVSLGLIPPIDGLAVVIGEFAIAVALIGKIIEQYIEDEI